MPKPDTQRLRFGISADLQAYYQQQAATEERKLYEVFSSAVHHFLELRAARLAKGGPVLYLRAPAGQIEQLVQLDKKGRADLIRACRADGIAVRAAIFTALTVTRLGALP